MDFESDFVAKQTRLPKRVSSAIFRACFDTSFRRVVMLRTRTAPEPRARAVAAAVAAGGGGRGNRQAFDLVINQGKDLDGNPIDLKAEPAEGAKPQTSKVRGWRVRISTGAHLEGANLRDAHLEGAKLHGAHLEGATSTSAFGGCVSSTKSAHLEGAQLARAFGGCGLRIWSTQLVPLTSDVKRRTNNGDYELVRKGTPTSLNTFNLGVLIKEKVDAKLMKLLKRTMFPKQAR